MGGKRGKREWLKVTDFVFLCIYVIWVCGIWGSLEEEGLGLRRSLSWRVSILWAPPRWQNDGHAQDFFITLSSLYILISLSQPYAYVSPPKPTPSHVCRLYIDPSKCAVHWTQRVLPVTYLSYMHILYIWKYPIYYICTYTGLLYPKILIITRSLKQGTYGVERKSSSVYVENVTDE